MIEPLLEIEGELSYTSLNIPPNNQEKNITPIKEVQNVIPDVGYDGLSKVVVDAIPDEYIEPIGTIEITQNGTHDVSNYANADINIPTGADEYFTGEIIGAAYSSGKTIQESLKKIPALANKTSEVKYLYYSCRNAESIDTSLIDTSNSTALDAMFGYCEKVVDLDIRHFDLTKVNSVSSLFAACHLLKNLLFDFSGLSGVVNINYMFDGCNSIVGLDFTGCSFVFNSCSCFIRSKSIVNLNLGNIGINPDSNGSITLNSIFEGCEKLKNVVWGDFFSNSHKVVSWISVFNGCLKLESLPSIDMSGATSISSLVSGCTSLMNLGGFINLGQSFTVKRANSNILHLVSSTLLTHDSLMNVINNLYDLNLSYNVADGGTLYTQQLSLGNVNKAKLTAEEIAIATSKGWTVV